MKLMYRSPMYGHGNLCPFGITCGIATLSCTRCTHYGGSVLHTVMGTEGDNNGRQREYYGGIIKCHNPGEITGKVLSKNDLSPDVWNNIERFMQAVDVVPRVYDNVMDFLDDCKRLGKNMYRDCVMLASPKK